MSAIASPTDSSQKRIALVGNPNAGKSTLFNCLTGLRQKVGNYPGVTVQRKIGQALLGRDNVELIDLPGTYSLAATSPDERVVADSLLGQIEQVEKPDLALCIVDATDLQRHLYLAFQVGRLGLPMIIALNRWDAARKRNINIDLSRLQEQLGVPVVPISASKAEGVTELKKAMGSALREKPTLNVGALPQPLNEAMAAARKDMPQDVAQSAPEALLLRALLAGDVGMLSRLGLSEANCEKVVENSRQALFKAGLNPQNAEAVLLYQSIKDIVEPCLKADGASHLAGSESIDGLLTHKWWGLVAFLALMYFVFQSVYSWAGPFMDAIDAGKGLVQEKVASMLESWPMLQSLATDGIVEGVGAVVIFLPQILILFFFIALLEDTGYMARAAFLMDKLFSWCGLSGKSFVPLLSSYACAIPGVMASRTIQDPKARLATILAAPFMSCSARLPVYVLMIGAFIEPRYGAAVAGMALFGMHFVGLLVAMPFVYALNKHVFRTPPQPFLLELPSYQAPRIKDVFLRMYSQGREFVKNAGTVIFAITIVIWALLYFPRSPEIAASVESEYAAAYAEQHDMSLEAAREAMFAGETELLEFMEHDISSAYIEQSIMGRIGKTLQPIFDPAGFDWKITVGVIASFPAREVIISTLGIIYSLGGDVDEETGSLRQSLADQKWVSEPRLGQPVFTIPVVLAVMVFFALCQQCGATLAVIAQETNWRWALGSFVFMTTLAWLAAVGVYQLGSLF